MSRVGLVDAEGIAAPTFKRCNCVQLHYLRIKIDERSRAFGLRPIPSFHFRRIAETLSFFSAASDGHRIQTPLQKKNS